MKLKSLSPLFVALLAAGVVSPAAIAAPAKNVIIMISDGASWGTWDAGNYYTYGSNAASVYAGFDVKLGMTTTPLNTSSKPTMNNKPMVSYDPAQAWATTKTSGKFDGYTYVEANYTDSAAAGTALAAGVKTYNNAINWSNMNEALPYITQNAKTLGKATGVVSSVAFSHATPASFAAQNISRNNYGAISEAMVNNTSVDLIMGTGNPMYNDNGQANATPNNYYMSQAAYNTVTGANSPRTLIQDKAEFEALANGSLNVNGPLMGLAKVGGTLQQARAGAAFNTEVPTLETMTQGALNYLGKDQDGFFVMIEGGAVDWAAHANQKDRLVEEQHDFNKSVEAAVSWVEANSNWEETLLIVTTDHGNASPMGLNSDTVAFEGVQNNGQGNMPDFRFWGSNHKNEVVPLYAMGAGADKLVGYANEFDAGFNRYVNTDGRFGDGHYLSNDEVAFAMNAAMVPEPETYAMLLAGLGLVAVARARRAAR